MEKIEFRAMIVLIGRESVASVGSPFMIQHDKVRTRDRVIIGYEPLGDIIRESNALSRYPFDRQDDFVKKTKPEKFWSQGVQG
jgi:hypothetical protein